MIVYFNDERKAVHPLPPARADSSTHPQTEKTRSDHR